MKASEPDLDSRVGDLESALRQVMDETKVSRSRSGQPLYIGAYRQGLEHFIRHTTAEMDRRGWPAVAQSFVNTLQVAVVLGFLGYLLNQTVFR